MTAAGVPVVLEPLDLAALMCSRVCHDVVNPVGAIINGLEVLDSEKDPEMQKYAFDLIRRSVEVASARLQFARIAFGASGSATAPIDVGDAEKICRASIEDEKFKLVWNVPRMFLPKNKGKLLLNLLLIAQAGLIRGGQITVDVKDENGHTDINLIATGTNVRVPQNVEMLLAGDSSDGTIDPRGAQVHYTGLLARSSNMKITLEVVDDALRVRAVSES